VGAAWLQGLLLSGRTGCVRRCCLWASAAGGSTGAAAGCYSSAPLRRPGVILPTAGIESTRLLLCWFLFDLHCIRQGVIPPLGHGVESTWMCVG
jgi:hypothetical protein